MEKRICPICGDISLLRICERCGHEIPDVSKQDLLERGPIKPSKSKQKDFLTQEERYNIIKAKAKKISDQKKGSTQAERYKKINVKAKIKPKQNSNPQSSIENPSIIQEIPIPKTNYFPQLEVVKDKHQRIRELEKKTENLSNLVCWTCCLFFPIGIILFIQYVSQLNELDRLKKDVKNTNGYGYKNNVYFIQNILTRRIKIGMAHDVFKRLKQLQTGSDGKLEIVGIVENKGSEFEKKMHNKFNRDRVSGEWFNPSEKLISYINSINDQPNIVNNTMKKNTKSKIPTTNLGGKTAGIWFILLVIGELVCINLFFGDHPITTNSALIMVGMISMILIMPIVLAYLWNKKRILQE